MPDAFPFGEDFIGPHEPEEPILGQAEDEVHHREREQFVGVDEDPVDATS